MAIFLNILNYFMRVQSLKKKLTAHQEVQRKIIIKERKRILFDQFRYSMTFSLYRRFVRRSSNEQKFSSHIEKLSGKMWKYEIFFVIRKEKNIFFNFSNPKGKSGIRANAEGHQDIFGVTFSLSSDRIPRESGCWGTSEIYKFNIQIYCSIFALKTHFT